VSSFEARIAALRRSVKRFDEALLEAASGVAGVDVFGVGGRVISAARALVEPAAIAAGPGRVRSALPEAEEAA
jgi:hypothetical protein